MAWTNPTTRSTGTFITASIWNTDLVDNLSYLKGIADQVDSYQIVRKTATETISASTTLQNDDHLLWAIAANEVWTFDGFILIEPAANGTVMDYKHTFTVPASCTGYWRDRLEAFGSDLNTSNSITATANVTLASNTGVNLLRIQGVVVNSTNAGTVNYQWAQLASSASNLSVNINSILFLNKIS